MTPIVLIVQRINYFRNCCVQFLISDHIIFFGDCTLTGCCSVKLALSFFSCSRNSSIFTAACSSTYLFIFFFANVLDVTYSSSNTAYCALRADSLMAKNELSNYFKSCRPVRIQIINLSWATAEQFGSCFGYVDLKLLAAHIKKYF